MENNQTMIQGIINYIDANLSDDLNLDVLAHTSGYSKYHLHRMFTAIVGLSVHVYIQRRRLTEAARSLVESDTPILDIALQSGYENQSSFTYSFRRMFRKSPDRYRRRGRFMPLQLPFQVQMNVELPGDRAMDVQLIEAGPHWMAGFTANTAKGFWVIGPCHGRLEKVRSSLPALCDAVYGINDYAQFDVNPDAICYDYTAAVSVPSDTVPHRDMDIKTLPAATYVVFTFHGKKKASTQHIAEYVHTQWFPQTQYRFNDEALYDFFEYDDAVDAKGHSRIRYWVPILPMDADSQPT